MPLSLSPREEGEGDRRLLVGLEKDCRGGVLPDAESDEGGGVGRDVGVAYAALGRGLELMEE